MSKWIKFLVGLGVGLSGLVILIAISILILAWSKSRELYRPKTLTLAEGISLGLESGEFDKEFENLPKEEFRVLSPWGYEIAGFYIPGHTANTVLFCHGFTMNRWSMMKYVPIFHRSGWNIIAFDHRMHGDSGGDTTTFGAMETKDLGVVVDAAFQRFSETQLLGLFGESMGSAIAMQYAFQDDRISFVIADSPFGNLDEVLRLRAEEIPIPQWLRDITLNLVKWFVHSQADYEVGDIRPDLDIMKTPIPLLLLHGEGDTYIPPASSIRMYEARKTIAPTSLELFPKSKHADSLIDHREEYESRLISWFQQYLSIDLTDALKNSP